MAATIDICSNYGNHTVVPESGSVVHEELMSDNYVRLVFSTKDRITIHLGDYIQTDWGKYVITKPQAGTYNKSTGGYDYDLQFNAPYYLWQNKLYKYEPNNGRYETNWSLTDTLKNHMKVFLRNLEYYDWKYSVSYNNNLGDDVLGRSVYISFSNVSILDALNTIADKFGMEWLVSDSTIVLTEKLAGSLFDPQIDLTVGKEVEDMSAENSSDEGINRYYVFGSTRNIPTDYRKNDKQILVNGVVQKRLMLPQGVDYIGSATLKTDEIKEGILVFDDVYPRTESTISEVSTVEKTVDESSSNTAEVDTTESSGTKSDTSATSSDTSSSTTDSSTDDSSKKVNIYRFKTDGFVFSQDYILSNSTLQVAFTSGKLAGMTFDLQFNPEGEAEKKVVETTDSTTNETKKETVNNPDAQLFEIVRNDTYGRWLPDDTLHPSKDDKFVLIGWDASKFKDWSGLVEKAEKELNEKASAYISKKGDAPMTYVCTMMADYMYGLDGDGKQNSAYSKVNTFYIGYPVNLHGGSFFNADSFGSRIVGYEYKLDKPYDGAQLYVGNSALYSRSKATESVLNDVKDTEINYRGGTYTPGGNGGGGNVFILRTNDHVNTPSDNNVYSALRSDRTFANKRKNDRISSLWTFTKGYGAKRGIRSHEYDNAGNEDNLFGHGFELINYQNSNGNTLSRLEVDELLVRVAAFFAQLEIRRISYVGGNYVFTSAGGKIYYADWLDSSGAVLEKTDANKANISKFRCYLYSDDGTTSTMNGFAEDDQVMCRTFNIEEGVHKNVSNKSYWRRCVGTGKGVIPGSGDTTEYQYVDLGNEKGDYDDTMTVGGMLVNFPDQGDALVQFGNWTNSARQAIIYLMVEGDNAPAIITWSNVGADGKHFTLPDEPDIQISPKGGNIFHGKFISADDKSDYKGMTIDEILEKLLDRIKEVENQADKKFELWFNGGTPHPNSATDTETNAPASDWNTDALKALHVQDLYYDTDKDPASDGGRAWRWLSHGTGDSVKYYWEEVTDKDTIDALEKARDLQNQVDDIVTDYVISKGSEKSALLVEWNNATSNYNKYIEQADDYGLKDTESYKALLRAYAALGKMLNGNANWTVGNLPKFIDDENFTKDTYLRDYPKNSNTKDVSTETVSPDDYRSAWKTYYEALAQLLADVTKAARALDQSNADAIDKEKSRIDNIVADGVLDQAEKISVRKEFMALWHELTDEGGLKDKGEDEKGNFYSDNIKASYETMARAFNTLGTYLNGGSTWNLETEVIEANLPLWINGDYTKDTQITATDYRSKWSGYYSSRAAYIGMLSKNAQSSADKAQNTADKKANVFVSADPPSPPYKKGDMWVQTDNGNNIMVCIKDSGDKYDANDWADLSDIYDKYDPRMLLANMADKVWEISGGFITGDQGKICVFLGYSSSIAGNEEGDILLSTDVKLMKWTDSSSWSEINNSTYVDTFNSVYNALGAVTITIYSAIPSTNPIEHDLVLRTISWHDPFKDETVDGNVEVLMYNGKSWETLKECTRAIIENLGDEIRTVVFGSDGEGGILSSGMMTLKGMSNVMTKWFKKDGTLVDNGLLTTEKASTLYSKMVDADGNIVREANVSTYVTKDDNGVLESGVIISADEINFLGKMLINGNFIIDEYGNITVNNITANGTINALRGRIGGTLEYDHTTGAQTIKGGFEISGNGLTNIVGKDDMEKENMAYIICRNDTYGRFAGIGANILPASSGSAAVARFENNDKEGWYTENIAMILQAQGQSKWSYGVATKNIACATYGGCFTGFALGVKIIDATSTAQTVYLKRSDNVVTCIGGNQIDLYLLDAHTYDDGHVFIIKKDGNCDLRIHPYYSYDQNGTQQTTYLRHDKGDIVYGITDYLSVISWMDSMMLIYHAGLYVTNNNKKYVGGWVQYILPRVW